MSLAFSQWMFTAIHLRHILEMGSTKWATVVKLKGKQHSMRCILPLALQQILSCATVVFFLCVLIKQ